MQEYGIDSHKLHLHPQRVANWLNGENIYPIYMEISPSGGCNHRCVFCSMDFMGYQPGFLDTQIIKKRLTECGTLGVKSVMFAGEGEPLLHKDIAELAETAYAANIAVSFTTNAVLLKKELARHLLPITSWIKVSCNGSTAENYAAIHRTTQKDFAKVLHNMEQAVELRSAHNHACTLGFQSILLPENTAHMPELASTVRDLGADYLVIKPYTRNPQSLDGKYDDISYDDCQELAQKLRSEERPDFKVIFRHEAMQRWDNKGMGFERCLALPFWAYIDAKANVWGCLRHLNEDLFHYGNLAEQSFAEVWNSQRRKTRLAHCEKDLDVRHCHVTCRMELINGYLWRLRNTQPHDSFI